MTGKTSLRIKASLSFTAAFLLLWGVCSAFVFLQTRKAVWESFDEQMRSRAEMVADRTSVDPRVVPLAQIDENYRIRFHAGDQVDVLYTPPAPLDRQLLESRHIVLEIPEDEGLLEIVYSQPSDETERTVRHLFLFILGVFFFGLAVSWILGYWLSGKILKPVKQVIASANGVDILNAAELLTEPHGNDELKQLIVSFNRMLKRIQTQTDNQNAFFASASHELRTPLSVMQMRLQVLLKENDLSPANRKAYEEQLEDIRRMVKMVNDFLLMSELKNGQVAVIKSECDLPELLMAICARNKNRMAARELSFRITLEPDSADFAVTADRDKLEIILSNLIENSVKYAAGRSLIRIEIRQENGVCISVKNEIRPDIYPDFEEIADQFYHSKPLHGEGSGLGLWIAHQLAGLQDISIRFCLESVRVFHASVHIP